MRSFHFCLDPQVDSLSSFLSKVDALVAKGEVACQMLQVRKECITRCTRDTVKRRCLPDACRQTTTRRSSRPSPTSTRRPGSSSKS